MRNGFHMLPALSTRFGTRLLLLALANITSATMAWACTEAYPGASAHLNIDTWDDTEADRLISTWQSPGAANFLGGCSETSSSPVDVTPNMPNLQFVRTVSIEGKSYPAFSVVGQSRSPLLIFRYIAGNGNGSSSEPFDVRNVLHSSGAGTRGWSRWSAIQVAGVSRGGQMEGIPNTSVGSITHVYPPNPSLRKVDYFSLSANVRARTCTLTNTPVTLDDAYATDMPAAGSTTGRKDFSVSMTCNGSFPVVMSLSDANAPSNTGSLLTPTKNATATGIKIEIMRGAIPVQFGQTWLLAMTQNGVQQIGLGARYYRIATSFSAGVVEGQAVITATYR